jgi:hypothetical protein
MTILLFKKKKKTLNTKAIEDIDQYLSFLFETFYLGYVAQAGLDS